MSIKSLMDAACHVEQAEQVLSVWMELGTADTGTTVMIGALQTLLNGVVDAMNQADVTMGQYELQAHKAGKL